MSRNWSISPYNSHPGVVSDLKFPSEVIFSDCTLREGEQQPGVVLSKEDKLRLAQALDEIGIQQLEVCMPAVSKEERESLYRISKAGLNAKTLAVCRILREEIDIASDCGAWGVVLSIPAGELQIKYKLKWTHEKIIEATQTILQYARGKGLYVVLSPYDTPRAEPDFLERLLKEAVQTGCMDRVRMVDTVGSASPEAVRFLVKKMIRTTALPIEVHCHNDFGLATANTIAGLSAGAEVASTVLNGMGERSGSAATEEVAWALKVLYGVDTHLRFEKLYAISEMLQQMSGVKLQPHKPVVGRNSFAQEAGLIVSGLLQHPFTAMAYRPELVGQKLSILLGKKSGKATIRMKLQELGMSGDERQIEKILDKVKTESQRKKSVVSDEEFLNIVNQVLQGGKNG